MAWISLRSKVLFRRRRESCEVRAMVARRSRSGPVAADGGGTGRTTMTARHHHGCGHPNRGRQPLVGTSAGAAMRRVLRFLCAAGLVIAGALAPTRDAIAVLIHIDTSVLPAATSARLD